MADLHSSSHLILIAEDEELIRLVVVEFLNVAGFNIIEASDAASALVQIHRVEGIELVFTDIQMPGAMDGHGWRHG